MDFNFGLLVPLILIQLFLMGLSLNHLIKNEVNYLPKWAWALIILFGEILGPTIFLIFGRKKD